MNIDVKLILTQLGIDFEPASNGFKVKCFHPENHLRGDQNPSCVVSDTVGGYKCFSCGASGNLNSIIKLKTGKNIYQFLGITKKEQKNIYYKSNRAEQYKKLKKTEFEIIQKGQFHNFNESPEINRFLNYYGFTDEFCQTYNIKYTHYAKIYTSKTIDESKVKAWTDRICIPIYYQGKIVNIEGRTFTDRKPKVLYVKGGISDCFFNLENISQDSRIILCEGIKGLAKIWQVDQNVISSQGSTLAPYQLSIIKDIDNLLVFCDNDEAGRRMLDIIDEVRDKEFYVAISDTEGEDPNDLSTQQIDFKLKNPETYGQFLTRESKLYKKREVTWN